MSFTSICRGGGESSKHGHHETAAFRGAENHHPRQCTEKTQADKFRDETGTRTSNGELITMPETVST